MWCWMAENYKWGRAYFHIKIQRMSLVPCEGDADVRSLKLAETFMLQFNKKTGILPANFTSPHP